MSVGLPNLRDTVDCVVAGLQDRARAVPSSLAQLQAVFLRVVAQAPTLDAALMRLAAAATACLHLEAVYYCRRNADQTWVLGEDLLRRAAGLSKQAREAILTASAGASRQERLQVVHDPHSAAWTMALPVLLQGRPPESLVGVSTAGAGQLELAAAVLQLAAAHVTLWHVLRDRTAHELDAHLSSALVEMLAGMAECSDLASAGIVLVNQTKAFLSCEMAALATCHSDGTNCRLTALSGVSQFDRQSQLVRSLEAAMAESLTRDGLTVWPPASEAERHGTLVHKQLCTDTGTVCVLSVPLRDGRGSLQGVWLVLGNDQLRQSPVAQNYLRAGAGPVAASLDLLDRARPGSVRRLARGLQERCRSRWGRVLLAGAVMVAGLLCLPFPYRLRCDCELQPVTRRFAVAPHAGILEKPLVEPGDVVREGQTLARLDGREIRWELAGLQAEYDRAAKQRDKAMAGHQTAAAQLASLEMQRLDQKMELLRHRATNLEVTSPLPGIVVSGDLRHVEGAPLSTGQVLFEIAPLDAMIVELEIPEEEIAYAEPGQTVTVRLDAYPRERWTGTITRIHPRCEMREHQSVFIGEVRQSNPAGTLRPGMRGQAKISAGLHPLGWNLFHRAWEWVALKLGW